MDIISVISIIGTVGIILGTTVMLSLGMYYAITGTQRGFNSLLLLWIVIVICLYVPI